MINYDFEPNAQRARALDARMHKELGMSLDHINSACAEKITYDRDRLANLICHLREGKNVLPTVFAKYYDLVISIEDKEYDTAEKLFEELSAADVIDTSIDIFALGDPAHGEESQIYLDLMNADKESNTGFAKPAPQAAEEFALRLQEGFQLLEDVLSELAEEIKSIIRQIIIIGSDPTKPMQVDGGSHYQLWGALFLNGSFHPDAIAVAEVLAHETAHSLLFGFCTQEALVDNEDDELYPSPLRVDKRPMDGIYHATFVSARMHWAMSQLAASDRLTAEQKERAQKAADLDLINFNAGYEVVAEHGRLTKTGAELMKSAKNYMDSVP